MDKLEFVPKVLTLLGCQKNSLNFLGGDCVKLLNCNRFLDFSCICNVMLCIGQLAFYEQNTNLFVKAVKDNRSFAALLLADI